MPPQQPRAQNHLNESGDLASRLIVDELGDTERLQVILYRLIIPNFGWQGEDNVRRLEGNLRMCH